MVVLLAVTMVMSIIGCDTGDGGDGGDDSD